MKMSREVSKEEFDKFISEYPIELVADVSGISEPPVKTYNDFSDGKVWPDSIVASVTLYESYPKEEDGGVYPYVWQGNKYRIRDK